MQSIKKPESRNQFNLIKYKTLRAKFENQKKKAFKLL